MPIFGKKRRGEERRGENLLCIPGHPDLVSANIIVGFFLTCVPLQGLQTTVPGGRINLIFRVHLLLTALASTVCQK